MANHPYNVGDEVLIRGVVARHDWNGDPIIQPSSGGRAFTISPAAITQSTPGEPRNEKSVVLDRYGFTWQRIAGLWQQGDVAHEWAYLLDHAGPVKVIYRGEP